MPSLEGLPYHHVELDDDVARHEMYQTMLSALERYGPEFGHEPGPRTRPRRQMGVGTEQWHEPGFHIDDALQTIDGPFIEAAGPTEGGYKATGVTELPEQLLHSNIYPGAPRFLNMGEFQKYFGRVDFQADARQMPLPDKSVGVFFCSCLGSMESDPTGKQIINTSLRGQTISEAHRLLKDEGMLIWQGGRLIDGAFARHLGFVLKHYRRDHWTMPGDDEDDDTWHMVFQKPNQDAAPSSLKKTSLQY